jgi:hypothetical protein
MIRSVVCLLTVAAMLAVVVPVQAGHGCQGAQGCGCHVQCPECQHYCKLSIDKEKVEKYCWEVECKPICIPRVHFPWECGCPPKCAKVKHVNVLKKKTYECEKCQYTWSPEPEECCAGGAGCCDGECDGTCGGTCDGGCDVGYTEGVEVTAPTEAQPEVAPEPAPPLTGQRPTWFDSAKAKAKAGQARAALPVRFLRAAKSRGTE